MVSFVKKIVERKLLFALLDSIKSPKLPLPKPPLSPFVETLVKLNVLLNAPAR